MKKIYLYGIGALLLAIYTFCLLTCHHTKETKPVVATPTESTLKVMEIPRIVLYSLPKPDSIKVASVVALEAIYQQPYYESKDSTGNIVKTASNDPAKVIFTDKTNKATQLDEKRIIAIFPCNYCDQLQKQ